MLSQTGSCIRTNVFSWFAEWLEFELKQVWYNKEVRLVLSRYKVIIFLSLVVVVLREFIHESGHGSPWVKPCGVFVEAKESWCYFDL